MSSRFHKLLALLLAAALLICLPACGGDEDPQDPDSPLVTGNGDPTTTTEPPVFTINPLTGKSDMAESSSDRPVGVMIANNDFIQGDQVGIADADMWMETETEGGITRIMAVFANSSRLPASVGPVRSARSPFVHVAEAIGIAYIHAGGSPPAIEHISWADIADINLDTGEGANYSWRDEEYRQSHDYEFCLRTGGEEITRFMQDHEYSMTATRSVPWTFGKQSGEQAERVSLMISGSQRVTFVYDEQSGSYNKYNGYSETRHCDINGKPLQAETVLVLYTDKFWESDETIDFYLQNGTGYLFSQGVTRRFEWSRGDNGFVMTEENGGQLTVGRGRVYLCVVSTEQEGRIEY